MANNKFGRDLTEEELRGLIEQYRNEGKYDYDFQKDALMAQIILELREMRIEPL